MSTPARIVDSKSGNAARVTDFGQLVVAPLAYSNPKKILLAVVNQVYNFIAPAQDQAIVITDVIASANKNVSPTAPASISIYGSDGAASLTQLTEILAPQLTSGGNFIATGLNLLVNEGQWVNAFTDDEAVNLTIAFYRVPRINNNA